MGKSTNAHVNPLAPRRLQPTTSRLLRGLARDIFQATQDWADAVTLTKLVREFGDGETPESVARAAQELVDAGLCSWLEETDEGEAVLLSVDCFLLPVDVASISADGLVHVRPIAHFDEPLMTGEYVAEHAELIPVSGVGTYDPAPDFPGVSGTWVQTAILNCIQLRDHRTMPFDDSGFSIPDDVR